MLKLNIADLSHILAQIKIAETHVASGYTQYVDSLGNPVGTLVPWGLRTVSGEYNNLININSGAADLPMTRLLTPTFQIAPTTSIDFDGAGPAPATQISGTAITVDMNGPAPGGQTQISTDYSQIGGYVIDSQPRTISNLISDQSANNGAAIIAALTAVGHPDPYAGAQEYLGAAEAVQAANAAVVAAQADNAAKQVALTSAEAAAAAAAAAAAEAAAAAAPAQAAIDAAAAEVAAANAALASAQTALATAQATAATALANETAAQTALAAAQAATAAALIERNADVTARNAALAAFQAAAVASAAASNTAAIEQAEYDAMLAGSADPVALATQQAVVDAAVAAAEAAEAGATAAQTNATEKAQIAAASQVALQNAIDAENAALIARDTAQTAKTAADAVVTSKTTARDAAQSAVNTAQTAADAAATQLLAAQQADAAAQLAKSNAQSALAAAETALVDALAEQAGAATALSVAQAAATAAADAVTTATATRDADAANAAALDGAADGLEAQIPGLQVNVTTAQQDLTDAQADYAAAIEGTGDLAAASQAANATAAASLATLTSLQADKAAADAALLTAQQRKVDADADVVAKTAARDAAQDAYDAAALAADATAADVAIAQQANDDAQAALQGANAALLLADAELDAAIADAQLKDAALVTADAALDGAIATRQAAEAQNILDDAAAAAAQDAADAALAAVSTAQTAVTAAQQAQTVAQTAVASAQDGVDQANAEVTSTAAAAAQTQATLDAATLAKSGAEATLLSAQSAQATADALVTDKEAAVTAAQAALTQANDAATVAAAALAAAQTAFANAEAANTAALAAKAEKQALYDAAVTANQTAQAEFGAALTAYFAADALVTTRTTEKNAAQAAYDADPNETTQAALTSATTALDLAVAARTVALGTFLTELNEASAASSALTAATTALNTATTTANTAAAALATAQTNLDSATAANSSAQDAVTAATTAVADAEAALVAAEQAAADRAADVTAAQTALDTATANYDTALAADIAADAAAAAAVTAAGTAAALLADKQAALVAAEADVASAQAAVTAAQDGATAAAALAASTAETAAQSQAVLDDAIAAQTVAQTDYDAAVNAKADADALVVTKTTALTAAQGNVEAATTAAATAAADLATAEGADATAQSNKADAQTALNGAQAALTAALAEQAAANEAIAPLAAAATAAAAAVVAAEAQYTADAAAAADALAALEEATGDLSGLLLAIETAEGNLADAEAALSAAQSAAAGARDAADAAALTAAQSQNALDLAIAAKAEADLAVTAAEGRKSLADLDVAAKTEARDDAQSAFDAASSIAAGTAIDLAAAQGVSTAAAADLLAAQQTLQTAQGELDAATAAAGTAQSDLATAQATYDAAVVDRTAKAGEAAAAAAAAAEAAAQAVTAEDAAVAARATADAEQAELDLLMGTGPSQAALDAQLAIVNAANAAAAQAQTAFDAATEAYIVAVQDAAASQLAYTNAQAAQTAALNALNAASTALASANAAVDTAEAAVDAAQTDLTDAQGDLATAQATGEALVTAADEAADAAALADTALATAQANATAAANALTSAQADVDVREEAVGTTAESLGLEFDANTNSLVIPNVMPDLGDTAPYNSFLTLFGQFFDHGLDLVSKGGSGTVLVPLQPDDPLYVPGSPTNFMVLTRATNQPGADGILGTADDVREHTNETTPWIDLNQVYTSHESHQVFLREYVLDADGKPIATGHMLEGVHGGPPTWADIKAQAKDMLGIQLSDHDVGRVPLVLTDLYGKFIPGPNGYAQLVVQAGPPPVIVEGSPTEPVAASQALAAGHAFLNDIAHNAAPDAGEVADADTATSTAADRQPTGTYDNELLDKHFIVGDGRGNENIGLTAVHHVFHSEHNHRVEQVKHELIANGDVAFLNEWLRVDVTEIPTTGDLAAWEASLQWDGERLFQAGRFSTEMVYQHLVFEEFARLVSPDIDPFVFSNNVDIDGAIVAEFAHVVYRFGHSMLNENVDRLSADGQTSDNIGLIEAFLNPVEYVESGVDSGEAAGAIIRGMTRQVGNEIDEFLVEALRNNLVGLPLDLGALNIARGRDTGIPSLNNARAQFYEQTGDTRLKPYDSWYDFALNLKTPASIINFIAAYGTHSSITSAVGLEAKRDAAAAIVLGGTGAPADRLDFLNATGAWAGGSLGGLNTVDFWIGGLAEAKMVFGGLLGSTFNFVFEYQMEQLQAGDRFYYLSRTQGMNLLNQLEADSFAELVMRNTDLGEEGATHLPSSLFLTPAYILELDQMRQNTGLGADGRADPTSTDPILGNINPLVTRLDTNNDGEMDYLRYDGVDHVVIGGTNKDNTLIGGIGDDTIWGDGGNDRIEGGLGVDHLFGGTGDDIITDSGNDIGAGDVIHGDDGNDVINGGIGLDLIFGGRGNDFIFGGSEGKDITAGEGNDFVSGPSGQSFIKGNEGDDWLEGGSGSAGLDTLAGENSELFFNSPIIGHDVLNGRQGDTDYDAESGDDIMIQGNGIERNNGMAGFDWAIHKGNNVAADSDLGVPIFVNQQANILRDRFDLVEGLSGWVHDDTLTGRDTVIGAYDAITFAAAQFDPATTPFQSYSNALTEEGVARIDGLDDLVAHLGRVSFTVAGKVQTVVVMDEALVQRDANGNVVTMFDGPTGSDILLGGGGSDTIQGKAGNDIIDGDKWLNVRIRISNAQGQEIGSADSVTGQVYDNATGATLFGGRTLDQLMMDRTLNPGQLSIVREILDGDASNTGIDTAVFSGNVDDYDIIFNDDGSITVDHARFTPNPNLPEGARNISDGVDRLFNIERLQFADAVVARPTVDLHAFNPGGNYRDQFGTTAYNNSNGSTAWTTFWTEANDRTATLQAPNVAANGEILITNGRLQFQADLATPANAAGASITRGVDLSMVGNGAATLSFNYVETGLDAGETLQVQFSSDGVNFTTMQTINAVSNTGTASIALTGPYTANSAIRFLFSGVNQTGETVTIDNVDVTYVTPSNDGTNSWQATFTEDGAAVGISNRSGISAAGEMTGAQIVITNTKAGDALTTVGLPGAIAATTEVVNGNLVMTLSGVASATVYQQAIDAVRFSNSSQAPDTTPRVIEVTVSAALNATQTIDSAVVTSTINVVSVDDEMNARNDSIVTNFAAGTAFNVNVADLLANDTDADGPVAISTITTTTGLAATLNGAATLVQVNDDATAGGSFVYRGTGTDTATVTLTRDNTGTLSGTANADIIIANSANSTIDGDGGRDVIYGGGGNDIFDYNATADALAIGAVTADNVGQLEVIRDWSAGDRIDLSGIDARTGLLNFGDQAFTFLGNAAFTSANQSGGLRTVQLQDAGGQWYTVVEASTDNDLDAELQLALLGQHNLTSGDFFL